MNKISILGAGASGLLCAIFCAKESKRQEKPLTIEVYEQNNKCAKKILVSGNGRCNIINRSISNNDFFSEDSSFVEFSIKQFGFNEFSKFCNSIGLLLDVKDDGRAYPLSNEAKSVVKILEEYAKSLGVIFHLDTKVTNIKELVKKSHSVVVATGSLAASHLGGNDDGHNFAKEFGHNIIAPYPSLVQLHIDSSIVHNISGAKVNGEVTLLINHKVDSSAKGDILFTNYGVSGFGVLDISHKASVALQNFEHVSVSLNLLPDFNSQKISSHIINTSQNMSQFSLIDILIGLIPIKIASAILDALKIKHSLKGDEINTKLSKKIANSLLNWRFEVSDTHGFRHAEVSGGGVDVSEVNPKSMESLKQKNLYFCGEVLDVVGRRGGYNFAFAWASGYAASKEILKKL